MAKVRGCPVFLLSFLSFVCGAYKADAERAGFDEGDKPEQWQAALEQRGIKVRTGVLAQEAAELFSYYHQQGGEIYNADKRVH